MTLRLSNIEVQLNDINNGSVLHTLDTPHSIDEVREFVLNMVSTIEEEFGYDLNIE